MRKIRKTKRPTLKDLEGWSRLGRFNLDEKMIAGVRIVSREGQRLRVLVYYGSRRVWLQERRNGAAIQLEIGRGKEDRWSTGTTNWKEAIKEADNFVHRALMEDTRDAEIESAARVAARTGQGASIAQLSDLFQRERIDETKRPVSDKDAANVHRVLHILEIKKGASFSPSQIVPIKFVKWYLELRTNTRVHFPDDWHLRSTGPVIERTAIAELKDFSRVLKLGVAHQLLRENPLEDFEYSRFLPAGDAGVPEHREEASIARYRALIEPPVHPDTGEPLINPATGLPHLAPVHECFATDGGFRLRFYLACLFFTGRRNSDFLGSSSGRVLYFPTLADLLWTEEEIRAALRDAPNHREWWAEFYIQHGAYRANRNKMNHHRIIPFGAAWARERDLWLAHHPAPDDPRAALFPASKNPYKPLDSSRMRKHLVDAERIAREFSIRMGLDPNKRVPELKDSRSHGFRPLWRTMMDQLGYSFTTNSTRGEGDDGPPLNDHAVYYGGWTIGGEVQSKVYSRIRPQWLVGIANFRPAAEVVAESVESLQDELAAVLGD